MARLLILLDEGNSGEIGGFGGLLLLCMILMFLSIMSMIILVCGGAADHVWGGLFRKKKGGSISNMAVHYGFNAVVTVVAVAAELAVMVMVVVVSAVTTVVVAGAVVAAVVAEVELSKVLQLSLKILSLVYANVVVDPISNVISEGLWLMWD